MVRQYLETSKMIFDCKDIYALREMYKNAKEIYDMPRAVLDSNFRCFFARLKNEKLYMPVNKDKIFIDGEEAYLIPPDSYWQLTSLEAYTKSNSDEPVVQDWNSKKIRNHLICTVFGGTKNMSLPPVHGVCYCFAGYDERALIKSAPWDVGGWSFSNKFEAYRMNSTFHSKFCTPETQLEETIRRHNEDELERKSYRYAYDNIFKLQPSYTASFVEPPLEKYFNRALGFDDVLTAEKLKEVVDYSKMNDISYRQSIIAKELREDPKWKKTIEDARHKSLKKSIVDMTHDLIYERLKMDQKEQELLNYSNEDLNDSNKMSRFLQLIGEIIYDFDECRAGVIQHEVLGWNSDGGSEYGDIVHKELYEKLFSYKVMTDKLKKMEAKFKSLDEKKYTMCMNKMKEVSKKQVDKLELQYWWYEYDTSHDWYEYYKHASRSISGISKENEKSSIKNLLDMYVPSLSMTGGQAVKKTIEEIKNIREYDIKPGNPDWHGRRHINNVVLFSYLIAKKEGIIGNYMDLLLQAAKYHDVGRDGIWNGLGEGKRHDESLIPHAYPSALAAEFYMKKELNPDGSRKYSDRQIGMVKVAIEYHEVNEKNKNEFNYDIFTSLCLKEGVNISDYEFARLLCIYLKDADALDRTRFLYEDNVSMFARDYKDNLDWTFLRTDTAVALRDYARSINDIHYKNRSGQLYIPQELNYYSVPQYSVRQLANWDTTKAEIRAFLLNRNIKGELLEYSKQDIIDVVERVKNKKKLFEVRKKTHARMKNATKRRGVKDK